MAELATTCIALAEFALRASKCINEFIHGVRTYNERVCDLGSKLQMLSESLREASTAAHDIESLTGLQQSSSQLLSGIWKAVDQSEETLRVLTKCLGKLGAPNSMSTFKRVIRHWCYEYGSKPAIDKALEDIDDRRNAIHFALTCINTRLMCRRYSQCGKSSIISWDGFDDPQPGPPLTKDFSRTSRIASFDTSKTFCEESSSISETLSKRESITFSFASSFSQALILAIQTTKPGDVHAQLERGADILARDRDGCCALHYAVRAGGRRVLSELLNSEQLKGDLKGIDQPDKSGATPLHYAASIGNMEFAKILIQAGADKDAVDHHKRSPLHMAVNGNHENLVELLMDRGAKENPNLPPRFKEMQNSIKLRKRRQEKDAKKKKTR